MSRKGIVKQCRYCDGTNPVQYPGEIEGFKVCSNCGAEWDPVDVVVDYDELDRELEMLDRELARYEAMEEPEDEFPCIGCHGDCTLCPNS